MGDAATAPQRPAYQQAQYQQPAYQPAAYEPPQAAQQPYRRQKGEYEYGYFDIFYGMGSPNMSLEFANPSNTIFGTSHLGLPVGSSFTGPFRSVKVDKIQTAGFGPVAMRVGGFGNGNAGGAFEFGLERRNIKQQTTTVSMNGGAPKGLIFLTDDYLTLTSFYMAGNLMIRFTKKAPVEPYIGFGLGLSLNAVSLPYVKGYTNSATFSAPTDDFGLGLVFNIPFGVRFKVADKTQLVAEMRYQVNTLTFDRGVTSERDVITVSGVYFNVGMGFNF